MQCLDETSTTSRLDGQADRTGPQPGVRRNPAGLAPGVTLVGKLVPVR